MAAGIDAVQLARVKATLEITSTDHDDFLQDVIDAVSDEFEAFLDRPLESTTVTQEFDVEPRQIRFNLDATPVSSITSIKNSTSWSWAEVSAIDSTAYHHDSDTGQLFVDANLSPGFRSLQVVWVGGLAADAATLESSYPAIARAAELQVTHEYRRKGREGAQSVKQGGHSGSYFGQLKLLERVVQLLSPHRRVAWL